MRGGNLGIFDDDGGFFRDSSDDILAIIERNFVFESGMVMEDNVSDDRLVSLHSG